jgi:acetyl-CoA decarbonylase/synthase complex subunit gamma
MAAGLRLVDGERPLMHAADASNWQAMGDLAKQHGAALAVVATRWTGWPTDAKLKELGVTDLALDPAARQLGASLIVNTQIRRLALRKNFRPLGCPDHRVSWRRW